MSLRMCRRSSSFATVLDPLLFDPAGLALCLSFNLKQTDPNTMSRHCNRTWSCDATSVISCLRMKRLAERLVAEQDVFLLEFSVRDTRRHRSLHDWHIQLT